MSNPHDPNSAQWAAREKELADRGMSTGTYVNQDRMKQNDSRNHGGGGSGGGSGCFPAGTRITTLLGTQYIDAIKAGDHVLGWDPVEQRSIPVEVLKVKVHKPQVITVLTFRSGEALRTTDTHSLAVPGGWRQVSRIAVGEKINTPEGHQIVAAISYEEPEAVFNLVTAHCFTFIADGVVAHNFTWFKNLRMTYWMLRQNGWRIFQRKPKATTQLA